MKPTLLFALTTITAPLAACASPEARRAKADTLAILRAAVPNPMSELREQWHPLRIRIVGDTAWVTGDLREKKPRPRVGTHTATRVARVERHDGKWVPWSESDTVVDAYPDPDPLPVPRRPQ